MRFKTKPIELEAVKHVGNKIPKFVQKRIVETELNDTLVIDTDEGERHCKIGDYFVLTDAGQVLVRSGGIFEAIFEPAA